MLIHVGSFLFGLIMGGSIGAVIMAIFAVGSKAGDQINRKGFDERV
jgi:tetrahydromethanopterin S-methyltransferase subunit E